MSTIVPTPEFSDKNLQPIKVSSIYVSFVPTLKMN